MISRRRVLLLAAGAVLAPRRILAQPAVLKSGDVLRGRFVQERHLSGFATPIRSEGSFVLSPGEGLIWRVEKPLATTTVVTPAGLVQLASDGREMTRLPAARAPFLARLFDLLNAVLQGNPAELEQVFTVTRRSEGAHEHLQLMPRRPEDIATSRIQSIAVTLGRFAEDVEIRRADDDFDRLSFTGQAVTPAPLTDEEAKLFASAKS
jgi:Outer membrane lipoprotein carrier protein LolA-like